MYLMDTSGPPINNRKWNLGRLRGLGLSPVRLPNLGYSTTGQEWRRNLGRLGSTPASAAIIYRDPATGWSQDSAGNTYDANGNAVALRDVPSAVGAQNPSPVAGGASNGGITTVRAGQPSTNALDYPSPQMAVAAGLDPEKVFARWSLALAQFSSPQAAVNAGIPAGVVNQLWQQANVNAVNAAREKRAQRRRSSWLFGLGQDESVPIDTTSELPIGGTLTPPSDLGPTFNVPLLPSTAGETTSELPIGGTLTPPPALTVPLLPSNPASAASAIQAGSIGAAQLLSLQPSVPAPAAAAAPFSISPNTSKLLLYGGGTLLVLSIIAGGRRRR